MGSKHSYIYIYIYIYIYNQKLILKNNENKNFPSLIKDTTTVDQFFIEIKFLPLLPKDYYLIPSKGTKNLFRPNRTCILVIKMDFSMNLLKI